MRILGPLLFLLMVSTATAYADDVIITIHCQDVEYIAIDSIPAGYAADDDRCREGCLFPVYYLAMDAAQRVKREYDAHKENVRSVFLEGSLLVAALPDPYELPLPIMVMSADAFFPTYAEALAHALTICPNVPFDKQP